MSSLINDENLIGRRLGSYQLREKIGEDSFCSIYRARQLQLSREAIIRLLLSNHANNQTLIDRFHHEARLAFRLEHPYAALIYDFDTESDGLSWIAMEQINGITLSDQLRLNGLMPLELFAPLLERICEVVQLRIFSVLFIGI
jgi:eukaryotic-like serine/threonine-protein kinase